jgi:periplasmic protein TonB
MLPREYPFLGRALAISLLLHAALIAAMARLDSPSPLLKTPALPVLNVALPEKPVEAQPPMPAQPPLLLPESTPRHASAAKPVAAARQPREDAPSVARQRLAGEAARQAMQQLSRELYYPPEAVERGLEGEALVLLFLDASGNAIAARLEASSGHALLDDAAVKAARTLRSLPDSAPREALLPVRFRLR